MKLNLGKVEIFYLSRLTFLMCIVMFVNCRPSVEERMLTATSSKDQKVLAKLATLDDNYDIRYAALKRISDQSSLAEVVINTKYQNLKKLAFDKLSDQELFMKVAMEVESFEVFKAAVLKISDQDSLANIVMNIVGIDRMEVALERLSDQKSLSKVVLEHSNDEIREATILKLIDQATLYRVASEDKVLKIRILAIRQMKDQSLLIKLASEHPAAAIRLAAVSKVRNDDFLLKRSREDISKAVRLAAVEGIQKRSNLVRVIKENYSRDLRDAAYDEMKMRTRWGHTLNTEGYWTKLYKQLDEVAAQSDQEALAHLTLIGDFDDVCMAAAKQIKQQEILGKVAIETSDREVCKFVFEKLTDNSVIESIATNAREKAIGIAAAVKIGQTSWSDVFDEASGDSAGAVALGEALAAVDLFSKQIDAKEAVVQACLNFIVRGDESRIPELVNLLDLYGDERLAEDYLNCGQPDLDDAGRAWARKHGYSINKGYGSNRARWGSKKRN